MSKRIFMISALSLLFIPLLFAETAGGTDKNIVNFKLCCAVQNKDCDKTILKLPSGKTEEIFVESKPVLTIDDIVSASAVTVPVYIKGIRLQHTSIVLKFTDKGKEKLREITSKNINKQMAVFINGNLIMAPFIKMPVSGGEIEITGGPAEEKEEAKSLVDTINKAIEENAGK
ncbi:MAG: hypothetical protein PHP17_01930 [Candidatus Omnitrophica bacterium]|nr:hypothetical protein [Candidatus Omnitrophota bacterium]